MTLLPEDRLPAPHPWHRRELRGCAGARGTVSAVCQPQAACQLRRPDTDALSERQHGSRPPDRRAGNTRARTTWYSSPGCGCATSPPARWQRGSGARRHAGRAHAPDRHRRYGAQVADRAVALRRDRAGAGGRGGRSARHRDRFRQISRTRWEGVRPSSSMVIQLPSGRLVAPYRGHASCMRHYGAGST